MTKYDTTGPVTLNETASLVCFLALLGMIATGAWLGLELQDLPNQHRILQPVAPSTLPVATAPAAPRGPDDLVEGVNRLAADSAIVKAGDTLVVITQSEKSVWSSRTYPRDNPDLSERWRFANIANNIARDQTFAERFDAANVAEKLRGLNLRPPRLTPAQVNQLRDLYLAAQDAKTSEERVRADQALHDAVAAMPITAEEQQSFDSAVEAARALLSPHQLELIRIGGKKEPPPRSAPPAGGPTTRTAAPSSAPTTTSRPAPAQKGP